MLNTLLYYNCIVNKVNHIINTSMLQSFFNGGFRDGFFSKSLIHLFAGIGTTKIGSRVHHMN